MVYKSVDQGKLWSICFLPYIFFFYEKPKTKQLALRDMLRHFHGLYSHRPSLSNYQRARIRSVIVKILPDKSLSFAGVQRQLVYFLDLL